MFQYPITFPKTGMYRVLGDFYPDRRDAAADDAKPCSCRAPAPDPVRLGRDYSAKGRSQHARVAC